MDSVPRIPLLTETSDGAIEIERFSLGRRKVASGIFPIRNTVIKKFSVLKTSPPMIRKLVGPSKESNYKIRKKITGTNSTTGSHITNSGTESSVLADRNNDTSNKEQNNKQRLRRVPNILRNMKSGNIPEGPKVNSKVQSRKKYLEHPNKEREVIQQTSALKTSSTLQDDSLMKGAGPDEMKPRDKKESIVKKRNRKQVFVPFLSSAIDSSNSSTRGVSSPTKEPRKYSRKRKNNDNLKLSLPCERRNALHQDDALVNLTKSWDQSAVEREISFSRTNVSKDSKIVDECSNNAIFAELEKADYTSCCTMVDIGMDELHKLLSPVAEVPSGENEFPVISCSDNEDKTYKNCNDSGGSSETVGENIQRNNRGSNIAVWNRSSIMENLEEDDGSSDRLRELNKLLSHVVEVSNYEDNGNNDFDNEPKESDADYNESNEIVKKTYDSDLTNNNAVGKESSIATDVEGADDFCPRLKECNNNDPMPLLNQFLEQQEKMKAESCGSRNTICYKKGRDASTSNYSETYHSDRSIPLDNDEVLALKDHDYYKTLPELNEMALFEDEFSNPSFNVLGKLKVNNITSDSVLKTVNETLPVDILNSKELDIEHANTEKHWGNSPIEKLGSSIDDNVSESNFQVGQLLESFVDDHSNIDLYDFISGNLSCSKIDSMFETNDAIDLHDFLPLRSSSNLLPQLGENVNNDLMERWAFDCDTHNGNVGETIFDCETMIDEPVAKKVQPWLCSPLNDWELPIIDDCMMENLCNAVPDTNTGTCPSERSYDCTVSKCEDRDSENNNAHLHEDPSSTNKCKTFNCISVNNDDSSTEGVSKFEVGTFGYKGDIDCTIIQSEAAETSPVADFANYYEILGVLGAEDSDLKTIGSQDLGLLPIEHTKDGFELIAELSFSMQNCFISEFTETDSEARMVLDCDQNDNIVSHDTANVEIEQPLGALDLLTQVPSIIDDIQNNGSKESELEESHEVEQCSIMKTDASLTGSQSCTQLTPIIQLDTANVDNEQPFGALDLLTQVPSIIDDTQNNGSKESELEESHEVEQCSIMETDASLTGSQSCTRLTSITQLDTANVENKQPLGALDLLTQVPSIIDDTQNNGSKKSELEESHEVEQCSVMKTVASLTGSQTCTRLTPVCSNGMGISQIVDLTGIESFELPNSDNFSSSRNAAGKRRKKQMETLESHNLTISSNSHSVGKRRKKQWETLDSPNLGIPNRNIVVGERERRLKKWDSHIRSISTGTEPYSSLIPSLPNEIRTLQDKDLRGNETRNDQRSQTLVIPSNSKAGSISIAQREGLLIGNNFHGIENDCLKNLSNGSKFKPSIDTFIDHVANVPTTGSDESTLRNNNLRISSQQLEGSVSSKVLRTIDVNSNIPLAKSLNRQNKGLRYVSPSPYSSDKENVDIQNALANLIRESRANSGNIITVDSAVTVEKPRKRRQSQCQTYPMEYDKQDTLDAQCKEIHKGAIEYKCKGCSRLFNDENHFHRHSRYCTLCVTVYSCEECDKKYRYKSSLDVHMEVSHSTHSLFSKQRKRRKYECDETYRVYKKLEDSMKLHQKYRQTRSCVNTKIQESEKPKTSTM